MIIFNEENHTYIDMSNNNIIPSVTQILDKEGCYGDISNIPQDTLDRSQKFGTAVHRMCQLFDMGTLDTSKLDENLQPILSDWISVRKQLKLEVTENELLVFSKKWGFAGRLDKIAEDRLIDIKTSSTVSPAVALQTALYKVAYEEMTDKKIKERLCIQLTQEGFYVHSSKDKNSKIFSKIDEYIALGMVNSYKWKERHGIWRT